VTENGIRLFVNGCSPWLFSGIPRGAKASAALYGLIETAKANRLNSYDYLPRAYTDLSRAQTVEEIESLLPWNLQSVTEANPPNESKGGVS
jgi:hypothetical protein